MYVWKHFCCFWPIFDDIEGQRVLGRRIKPSPQPICLGLPQPPFSVLSGNSKPIFPDYGSNFVNKVEEACNPLSARVEGLLSQFSNLPNLLQANPTVVGKGKGCKYFLFEKNYANDKEMWFSLQGTYLRQPLGAVRQYLRAHDAGVLSFPNSTVPQQPLALLAHLLHPLDPEPWPRLEVWVSCHRVRRSKVLVTSRPQQLCAHLRGSNLGGISRENVCGR